RHLHAGPNDPVLPVARELLEREGWRTIEVDGEAEPRVREAGAFTLPGLPRGIGGGRKPGIPPHPIDPPQPAPHRPRPRLGQDGAVHLLRWLGLPSAATTRHSDGWHGLTPVRGWCGA